MNDPDLYQPQVLDAISIRQLQAQARGTDLPVISRMELAALLDAYVERAAGVAAIKEATQRTLTDALNALIVRASLWADRRGVDGESLAAFLQMELRLFAESDLPADERNKLMVLIYTTQQRLKAEPVRAVTIYLNNKECKLTTFTHLSGAQLKVLGASDPIYDVSLESDDRLTHRWIKDQEMVHLKDGMHFRFSPPALFGGGG